MKAYLLLRSSSSETLATPLNLNIMSKLPRGLFLTLYLGLQIGLPDSFRTGGNTINNYVYCILLDDVYEKRYLHEEPQHS